MQTLREYLECEAFEYGWLSQEEHNGSHRHWWFAGHAKMCRKLLSCLDDAALDMPIELKEEC